MTAGRSELIAAGRELHGERGEHGWAAGRQRQRAAGQTAADGLHWPHYTPPEVAAARLAVAAAVLCLQEALAAYCHYVQPCSKVLMGVQVPPEVRGSTCDECCASQPACASMRVCIN